MSRLTKSGEKLLRGDPDCTRARILWDEPAVSMCLFSCGWVTSTKSTLSFFDLFISFCRSAAALQSRRGPFSWCVSNLVGSSHPGFVSSRAELS